MRYLAVEESRLMLLVYAIPSLVAALTTIYLSFYIYRLNPKSKINRIIACFFVALFLESIAQSFLILVGSDLKSVVVWYPLIGTGSVLAMWLFLYFTQIFPTETGIVKSRMGKLIFTTLLAYGVFMFSFDIYRSISYESFQGGLSVNSLGFYSISDLSRTYWDGNHVFSWGFIAIMIVSSIFALTLRYTKETPRNRKKIAFLLCGAAIMYGLGYGSEIIISSRIVLPGLSSIGVIIMVVITSYAVVMRRIAIFKPEVEEKTVELTQPYEEGHYYVIIEDDYSNPEKSYGIFCRHIKGGRQGIVVTSRDPVEIRKKYGIEKTPVIWLTHRRSSIGGNYPYENVVSITPDTIGNIEESVLNFLTINKHSIVILDCLEYMVLENSHTLRQRFELLELARNFLSFILCSNAIMLIPEDRSWINTDASTDIVKAKNLLGTSNIWPILLLEQLLNSSITSIRKEQKEELKKILDKLANVDRFFSFIKYRGDEIIVDLRYTSRFTFNDAIHYLKLFIRETGNISFITPSAIKETLERYGVSRYEYDIETGYGYLMYTSGPLKCFEIFIELIEHNHSGIYISRSHPRAYEKLSEGVLEKAKFRWMTDVGRGDYTIPPRLEHIQKEVEDFMDTSTDPQTIVVLDNLAYLLKHTGSFDEVHLLIANLRDIVTDRGGILLIPVDRKAFSDREKALLSEELVELDYTVSGEG